MEGQEIKIKVAVVVSACCKCDISRGQTWQFESCNGHAIEYVQNLQDKLHAMKTIIIVKLKTRIHLNKIETTRRKRKKIFQEDMSGKGKEPGEKRKQ